MKTLESKTLIKPFPDYCTHKNIENINLKSLKGKDRQQNKENSKFKNMINGPKFRIYDTRRRVIIA